MIARTRRDEGRKRTLKKGGISGAPKGVSLLSPFSLSFALVFLHFFSILSLFLVISRPDASVCHHPPFFSLSLSFSVVSLLLYHPFGENILFLPCTRNRHKHVCTPARTNARALTLTPTPNTHTRSLVYTRPLFAFLTLILIHSFARSSLCARASSLPSIRPPFLHTEGGESPPRGKIDSRWCPTLTPTLRPRRVCIHAPLAPTFRSGSWVTATALCSPSIVRKDLTPCTLLSRNAKQKHLFLQNN